MTRHSEFDVRMKSYELPTRHYLGTKGYHIIRVDMRSGHTHTRNADKPFDADFCHRMKAAALALCREVDGAVLAYGQSDEISVLMTDFATPTTETWFGGNINKIVSMSACTAALAYNAAGVPFRYQPMFDSRVFTLPSQIEVLNYFIWRQKDAIRNAVQMRGQAVFSQKQLHGKSVGEVIEMLKNVDEKEHSLDSTQGYVYAKTETGWAHSNPEKFKVEEGNWLWQHIPAALWL